MKIIILGSGGFSTTPKPLCKCKICRDARQHDYLKRSGPSIYLHELSTLIDTPLEAKQQIETLGNFPKKIIYSHWHPDHTEGWRVLESFTNKPTVYLPPDSKIAAKVPGLNQLQNNGKIDIVEWSKTAPLTNGVHTLEYIKISNSIPSYSFLYKGNNKKILICPDHAKFLLKIEPILGLDLLVMNIGVLDRVLYKRDKTNFIDNLLIINKFKPKKVLLTHIEEHFQLDSKKMEKIKRENKKHHISFATNNLTINL
jgi:phosphoribosyl 1,2-cyclic phosphate phosphodiesterase